MPDILFNVSIILLLILLNGVFALAEIALVSARRARLKQMVQDGSRSAQVALDLSDDPNQFLSTVQIGITLIGVFAGAFGGANIAGLLAEPMRDWPLIGPYAGAVSLMLVVGIITYLSVVIGELVPKRVALQHAERISVIIARPMRLLSAIARPVVHLLSISTDALLVLLGIETTPEDEASEEEIRLLVQESAQAGIIEEEERNMVESIFRLNDRPLDALMTPRPEIVWLDINMHADEIRNIVQSTAHSRFPVCDGDVDHVLGIAQAKDLLANCLDQQPLELKAMMHEPLFVPEKMHALTALERFKQSGTHMALLVDEYGGIEGLVTLINILEAIVGDIPTAEEIVDPPIVQREDGSWMVDGLISVEDFKEAFDIRALPGESNFQTLGGFMIHMLGSMPITGSHFGWGGYRFEVVDMDGHRVDKVLIESPPEERDENEDD